LENESKIKEKNMKTKSKLTMVLLAATAIFSVIACERTQQTVQTHDATVVAVDVRDSSTTTLSVVVDATTVSEVSH
jgi:uncharacterized protein YgiB involved in biofilm formation